MSQQVPMPGESNSNLSGGSLDREEQEVSMETIYFIDPEYHWNACICSVETIC